jgi:hypothetical protein
LIDSLYLGTGESRHPSEESSVLLEPLLRSSFIPALTSLQPLLHELDGLCVL